MITLRMQNIEKTVEYGIPHISSYALTAEPKTLLPASNTKNLFQTPMTKK